MRPKRQIGSSPSRSSRRSTTFSFTSLSCRPSSSMMLVRLRVPYGPKRSMFSSAQGATLSRAAAMKDHGLCLLWAETVADHQSRGPITSFKLIGPLGSGCNKDPKASNFSRRDLGSRSVERAGLEWIGETPTRRARPTQCHCIQMTARVSQCRSMPTPVLRSDGGQMQTSRKSNIVPVPVGIAQLLTCQSLLRRRSKTQAWPIRTRDARLGRLY
jgi:hypothetical protein